MVFLCAAPAVLSIAVLEIKFVYQLILLFVLIALMLQTLRNNKCRQLQWRPDGSWLITESNEQVVARLLAGSVVTPFFASLKFKTENNKSITLIIFKDNIDREKFRQLRVRLKVEGIKPQQSILHSND